MIMIHIDLNKINIFPSSLIHHFYSSRQTVLLIVREFITYFFKKANIFSIFTQMNLCLLIMIRYD